MRERNASSVVIVLAVLLPTLLGGPYFALSVLILGFAGYREYVALVQHTAPRALSTVDYVGLGSIVLFAGAAYLSTGVAALFMTVGLAVAIPVVPLLRTSPSSSGLKFASLISVGSLGLGLAIFAAISLRGESGEVASEWLSRLAQAFAIGGQPAARGLAWTLIVILCTWMNDSGAYLVGRSWGRHHLAPSVSPNKTIEGSVAGLIGSSLLGGIAFVAFGLGNWWLGALAGAAIGVAGQFGDLAESYLKRIAGVKDSGNLIPGHGGLLDRIDGLLFAFPTGYVLASAWEHWHA